MVKAIGYIRVSKEEQVKGGVSLDMQIAKIKQYCKTYDLELVDIERDDGISAKNIKGRPGATRAFNMMRNKEVGAIVVYKLDRLFRNRIDALLIEDETRHIGVAIHSVTERIDTTTALGRSFYTQIVDRAAFEREITSERTRDSLKYKREQGEVYNHEPYGYDAVEGKLVPNEEEQKVVVLIKERDVEGDSLKAIADRLNGAGIKTKKGKRWYPQTVKNVITLPVNNQG